MTTLPCDTEPSPDLSVFDAPSTSFYLTLRPRSFAEAVRDVSKVRDLPDWVFDLLREMRALRPSNIVDMAQARAERVLVRHAGRGV